MLTILSKLLTIFSRLLRNGTRLAGLSNPCKAECTGAAIKCHGSCPCLETKPCDCPTDVWEPVCGEDGFTYINFCKAKCDKTRVLCKGACPCQNEKANTGSSCTTVEGLNCVF